MEVIGKYDNEILVAVPHTTIDRNADRSNRTPPPEKHSPQTNYKAFYLFRKGN
jgi:hypothetical protein